VRDGHWKLLCEYDGAKPQLHELATDPGETTNLAAQHPDIVARLTRAVLEWNRTMPQDNGEKLGVEPLPAGGRKKSRAQ
jgi:uncharacterized sulfatase